MTFGEHWRAYSGLHGGYVMGRVLEAAIAQVPEQRPFSLQVQFTGEVAPGDAEIRCSPRHVGRRTATVDVVVYQGRSRVQATAKLGLDGSTPLIGPLLDLSHVPTPDGLRVVPPMYGDLPYDRLLDLRLIDGVGPRALTGTSGWIRFRGTVEDAEGLGRHGLAPVFLDALPPGLFGHDPAPVFVPTIDFSLNLAPVVDVRPGTWFHVRQETLWATSAFCLEEAALHTAEGVLVAVGRQTRRVQW